MAEKNPEIQIWISESKTKEERDEIVERSKKIEGCTVLFRGVNDDGKYVVIKAMTGKAITTPAVEFWGYKQFPERPDVFQLTKFAIIPTIEIKQT